MTLAEGSAELDDTDLISDAGDSTEWLGDSCSSSINSLLQTVSSYQLLDRVG